MNSQAFRVHHIVFLAIAYLVMGLLGLMLAAPPGYASPVFPAAGLALACVIWFGWRILPGVWLGSCLLNITHAWLGDSLDVSTMLVAVAIASWGTLQAATGRWLVLRWQGEACRTLETERDVLLFSFLGGVIAVVVSASLSVSTLEIAGVIGADSFWNNLWNWYVGDLFGVLVFAPLTLCLLARDDDLWRERRRSTVQLMVVTLSLAALSFLAASHWEKENLLDQVKSEGEVVAKGIESRLIAHREILSSLRNFIEASPDFTHAQFEKFTLRSLQSHPDIFAMSYNDYLKHADREAFEQRMSGLSPLGRFQIMERNAEQQLVPAAQREDYVAVRYIAPLQTNKPAVGYDIHSDPIRREAIHRALQSRDMAVTAPVSLVQDSTRHVGVLELWPISSRENASSPAASSRVVGFAVSVIKVGQLVQIATQNKVPAGLAFQLTDPMASEEKKLLYQYAPNEEVNAHSSAFARDVRWTFPLQVGDRQWHLTMYPTEWYQRHHHPWLAWFVGVVGLMFATLLQVLMLGMTGRTALIQRQNLALKKNQVDLLLADKVFENSKEAIVVTDVNGTIISINKAFTRITGFSEDDVHGRNMRILSSGRQSAAFYKQMWNTLLTTQRWEGEIWNKRKNGEEFPEWLSITVVRDSSGQVTHYVGSFTDLSESKATKAQLDFLAYHDPLTQLPNRRFGIDRIQMAMHQAQRNERMLAVLFMDLDKFKLINDTFGHSTGDALLSAMAKRLRSCLRDTDTLCRLSGDEFMIVIPDVQSQLEINVICKKILTESARVFHLPQGDLRTTFSIGVAVYPNDGVNTEVLLRNADTAMFEAKKSGRNICRFYDSQMNKDVVDYVQLTNELLLATRLQQFELHYQPQVSLKNGKVDGAEALIRWNHPKRGLLAPGAFIHTAEESGLIVQIGEWVIHQACRQAQAWRQAGMDFNLVSVNLSALQFQRSELETIVRKALEESGLPPQCLELELTESILIQDIAQVQVVLERLKDMGVQLSIDDFGTGYSSLAYLKHLKVDKLKIDRTFVQHAAVNDDDRAIVRAIIQMARSLNLRTIAEGVENQAVVDVLTELECDEAQGYFYSAPLAQADFVEFVARQG